MESITYQIIVTKWDSENFKFTNIIHATEVHTDNIDMMKEILTSKFTEAEDYEITITKQITTTTILEA